MIADLDAENGKRLNAYQHPFVSAWLNVVLKLIDQQLRISLSIRMGAKLRDTPGCETYLPLW